MKRNLILAGTILAAAAAVLGGCKPKPQEAADDKIVLEAISFMGEDTKRDGFAKLVEAFEEKHPGVTINVQHLDYGTYTTTLQTRIGAGDAPDLIFGTAILNQELVKSGQIEVLDQYDVLKSFTEEQLACMTIEGHTYGVPLDQMVIGAFYNRKMFEENGLTPPKTLSEFNAVCKTFEEKGIVPFIRPYKDAAYIQYDLDTQLYALIDRTKYYDFFTDLESGKTKFVDSAEMKEALNLFADRLELLSGDDLGTDPAVSSQLFAEGKSPMYINGSWVVGDILKSNPDGEFGLFAVPISDNEEENKMYAAVDDAWMVSATSEHKQEAVSFLEFITSEEGMGIWASNAKAITLKPVGDTELPSLLTEVADYIASGKTVNVDRYIYFSDEGTDKFNQNMQLFVNDRNVEELLKTLDNEFMSINK